MKKTLFLGPNRLFEDKLFEVLNPKGQGISTKKQRDALFKAGETKFLELPQNNISRIEFEINGKPQTRFTIPNARGLFNFKSVLKFLGR